MLASTCHSSPLPPSSCSTPIVTLSNQVGPQTHPAQRLLFDGELIGSQVQPHLAESQTQLLLRMMDYTKQTVELTRQELQMVVMGQVSTYWGQTLFGAAGSGPVEP